MQDRRFDATAHGRTDATDAVTDEDGEKIQQQNIVGRWRQSDSNVQK